MLKITAGSFITLEMEDQFCIPGSVYTVLNMSRLYFTPKSKERNKKCIIFIVMFNLLLKRFNSNEAHLPQKLINSLIN